MSPAFDRLAALPDTRRVARPRLVSRPMPQAWHRIGEMLVHLPTETTLEDPAELDAEGLEDLETYARDVLELMRWERHERAVRAQALQDQGALSRLAVELAGPLLKGSEQGEEGGR